MARKKTAKAVKTGQRKTLISHRRSRTEVCNKHPDYDYSFQRKEDLIDGGIANQNGWETVDGSNSSGETWGMNLQLKSQRNKTQKNVLNLGDTVLCRRHKEDTDLIKVRENTKYNNQMRLLNSAATNARNKLRPISDMAGITDQSQISGRQFTQRTGPTEA